MLREFTKNSTGRLVWACCLMADTQSALREGHQCPRSLSVTTLAQQKVVGDETSDIAMDDTAWLVHERTRKEGRVDKKSSRDSEELRSGSNGPKWLRTGCLRVSSVNALQDPPTREKRASRKVVRNTSNTCLTLARNRERNRSGQEICG